MHELIQQHAGVWLAGGGFAIGAAFGALIYATNFCTMGAVSDILSFGDYRRFRAWLLAAATALVATQVLRVFAALPIDGSMYLAPSFNWFGYVAGGLLFGFGMVFGGGCASRNLARAGGGDLRSLMTLMVMAVVAYMAIGGLFAPLRSTIEQATTIDLKRWHLASQSLGEIAAAVLHVSPIAGALLMTAVVSVAAIAYCAGSAEFRSSPKHVFSGLGVGLCVAAGWLLTGLAFDEFADKPMAPASLTFVRPVADTIEWMERFTAAMLPVFGVATVFGTLAGACAVAVMRGRFKLTTFANIADTRRSLFGAALMGIGGVMALGCTVGQAVTGVATLAAGSFVTFAALVAGAVLGIKRLERSLMDEI